MHAGRRQSILSAGVLTPLPLASATTDNFDDNAINAAKWVNGTAPAELYDPNYSIAGTSVSEAGGKAIVTPATSGAAGNGFAFTNTHDLTDNSVYIGALTFPSMALGQEAFFAFGSATNRYGFIVSEGGTLYWQRRINTNTTTSLGSYSATTHAKFRIRHVVADNTIKLDTATSTSADPPLESEWTNRVSETKNVGFPLTGRAAFGTATYTTAAAAQAVSFDGFNTATTGTATTAVSANVARTYAASAEVQAGVARTYAASAEVQAGVARTYTAVAEVQAGVGRVYFSAAEVQAGVGRTYTAVAEVQAGVARTYTTSAEVQAGVGRTYTAATEAVMTPVQAGVGRTYTAEAQVSAGVARTYTAEAVVSAGVGRVYFAAAEVQAGVARSYSAAAEVQAGVVRSYAAVTSVQAGVARTYAADVEVQAGVGRAYTADGVVQAGVTRSYSADGEAVASAFLSSGMAGTSGRYTKKTGPTVHVAPRTSVKDEPDEPTIDAGIDLQNAVLIRLLAGFAASRGASCH